MLALIVPMLSRDMFLFLATFNTVIVPTPCNAATVSAQDNAWMANKSLAMSLCFVAVARMSTKARSRIAEDIIIDALFVQILL
jgi:hypothetical protein